MSEAEKITKYGWVDVTVADEYVLYTDHLADKERAVINERERIMEILFEEEDLQIARARILDNTNEETLKWAAQFDCKPHPSLLTPAEEGNE